MPKLPNFVGPSYESQSLITDVEDTINLYVEQSQSRGAKSEAALYPTPGFERWSSVAQVGSRAAAVANGRLFWIVGSKLYEFDVNGTATERGTVALDGNPAQIIYNGVVGGQLGIAAGGTFYSYDLTSNIMTTVLVGEVNQLAYCHGYFLGFNSTNKRVRLSDLNNGLIWDPTNFFQRSLLADPWQAMFVDGNSLVWLIGSETFEVWYDTGTGLQPFAPLSGLVGTYGTAAPWSAGLRGAQPCWLAQNPEGAGQFVSGAGGQAKSLSTYAVSSAFTRYQRLSSITDTETLSFQIDGHTFIAITCPTASASWLYDLEGQSWTKIGRWNPTTGLYEVWAPRVHCLAFGKHLVGDRSSGTIAVMDPSLSVELDGSPIRRLRRSPGLTNEHARTPYDRLELLMQVGIGNQVAPGVDPVAMLRTSGDGGFTWGNERQAAIGRIGQYNKRVWWGRLGALVDAVFEVSFTCYSPIRITDAWLNNGNAESGGRA